MSLWLPVFSSVRVKLFSLVCVMRPLTSEPLRNLTLTRVSFLFSRFNTSALAFVSVFRVDCARTAGPNEDTQIARARKRVVRVRFMLSGLLVGRHSRPRVSRKERWPRKCHPQSVSRILRVPARVNEVLENEDEHGNQSTNQRHTENAQAHRNTGSCCHPKTSGRSQSLNLTLFVQF